MNSTALNAGVLTLGASGSAAASPRAWDAIVVGAGVFGAWTAWHLREAGKRVLLIDATGPAHARASSGGESRMTRTIYGADAIYSQMALASLPDWRALSARASLPILHEIGVLFFFDQMSDYARDSIATHRQLGLPLLQLDQAELKRRFPQVQFEGIEFGLFQTGFGALMARRAVIELVDRFIAAGGAFRIGLVSAPEAQPDGRIVIVNGESETADAVVYACGPWLGKLFPELLGARIFVTRQEIAFVAPPSGRDEFERHRLPAWADYNGGDLFYGFPNLETRGFKLARDRHGSQFDPDLGDRRMSAEGLAVLRNYLARRFPMLKDQPFVETRVCQYENSSNGDFLMDRHPDREGVWLLGAGSGHGFKHGPEVGRQMAALVLDGATATNPRFALSAKRTEQKRAIL